MTNFKILYLFSFIFLISCFGLKAKTFNESLSVNEPHEPQRIILKIKPEFANLVTNERLEINSLQNALATLGGGTLLRKFPRHNIPLTKLDPDGLPSANLAFMYELHYKNTNISVSDAILILLKTNSLSYAEPLYLRYSNYVPNDPQVNNQYHLAKIKAFEAWDITKSDTLITVGIVDSGVQLNHPDLSKKIQFNRADPIDGQDNDNDGFIDNFYGWDLAGSNFNTPIPDNNPTITGSNNTHGSHVAGIAAASTDNDTGVAGVGFRCRFLPIKCSADNDTRSSGSGFIYNGFGGIVYAADHGCQIINCSWGGGGFSEYEQEIIRYATYTKNALVVAAAGNNNTETDFFPASYRNVLSVAATNQTDLKAGFSNFNFAVGVSAPGQSILSCVWNKAYQSMSGTSMAAPVVSGMAALLKSIYPNYSPLQIRSLIQNTSDPIYTLGTNSNPIYWGRLGSGRVNILNSLNQNPSGLAYLQMQSNNRQNSIISSGDTVLIRFNFINYLASTSPAATLSISSENAQVSIIQPNYLIGVLATNQTKQQLLSETFIVKLSNNLAQNSMVNFRITLTEGNNAPKYMYARLKVNSNYVDIQANNISTSISSNGRLAFADDNNRQGIGFRHKNSANLAYEIGLMAGVSANKIVSTTRSTGNTRDNDFTNMQSPRFRLPLVLASAEVAGRYNDYNATLPFGLQIIHNTFAFTQNSADSNALIYQMQVTSLDTVRDFYIGFYADWDISSSSDKDSAGFSPAERLGYAHNLEPNPYFCGIAALGGLPNHCVAIRNDGVNSLFGVYDGFTRQEKFNSLSSSTGSARAGKTDGADISHIVALGPIQLLPGQPALVGFAFVAGRSLVEIRQAAHAAQTRYLAGLPVIIPTSNSSKTKANQAKIYAWPNPSKSGEFYLTNTESVYKMPIQVFDAQAKLVFTTLVPEKNTSVKLDLPTGIYQLRLPTGQVVKIVIVR